MILVSLPYDGGTAVVRRDADGVSLCAGSLCGALLDTHPGRVGLGGGRILVGGLLPPGASRAVVEGERAVADNGAWIAVLDSIGVHGEVAARYEAGDGAIIRPALPVRWAREPVPDADEPCPACGAVTWERVTPTDESRGYSRSSGGRMRPSAVIVCTRCGHEVEITTEAGRDVFVEAGYESACALMSVIHDAEPVSWGSASNAARALRIQAQRRAVAARVARAEPFAAELPVDGAPVRFAGFRDQAGWAAIGHTAQVRIVIAARGIEPGAVALRKL